MGKSKTSARPFFKECSSCSKVWQERDDFVSDENIEIVGYQVNFEQLKLGLFLFNHHECKTTLAIPAGHFLSLYSGPVYEERKTDSDACPAYCFNSGTLEACPTACECAYVREVIQVLKDTEGRNKVEGNA